MNNEEKAHLGKIYNPYDVNLFKKQLMLLDTIFEYNNTKPSDLNTRTKLLQNMFGEIGENCYIEPPLHANFGCKNVHFGKNIYANFNLTLVDDTHIYVGDNTMFGPNVTVVTAAHPISPKLREKQYQYNLPVHIGKNCWIGAGAIILPGISIGDNSVIGAGSIVTKNIPNNVVAVGNPCKILRNITQQDDIYYNHNEIIDIQ